MGAVPRNLNNVQIFTSLSLVCVHTYIMNFSLRLNIYKSILTYIKYFCDRNLFRNCINLKFFYVCICMKISQNQRNFYLEILVIKCKSPILYSGPIFNLIYII